MDKPDIPLIRAARQWIIDSYPYNAQHLLKALDWLDRIAPDATEAMRLATLTHDMERAFPGPDQPVQEKIDGLWADDEYNKAHSARSARIVVAWLREQHADEALIQEVERLIVAHEIGGWPEANLVQAADSLSFLEANIDLFLDMARSGKRTLDEVMIKFFVTCERIQVPAAREWALPMYEAAKERVRQLLNEPNPQWSNCHLAEVLLVDSWAVFIRMITFYLRGSLSVCKGFAQVLGESFDGQERLNDEEVKEMLRNIEKAANSGIEITGAAWSFGELRWKYGLQRDMPSS